MSQVSNRPEVPVILVAEDDENHAFFIERAFPQVGLRNPVFFVSDGAQAIAYLKGEGGFANRREFPLPSLLLLDLKMPNKDGFEVLTWLRRQPTLKALRVVVFTTSGAVHDITRAYELGANSFLTKPMNFTDLVDLTRWIQGYWLQFSREPDLDRSPRETPTPSPVQVRADSLPAQRTLGTD